MFQILEKIIMQYRVLGKTGYKVSEISIGTWQLGGKWGESFNEEIAQKTLSTAVANNTVSQAKYGIWTPQRSIL